MFAISVYDQEYDRSPLPCSCGSPGSVSCVYLLVELWCVVLLLLQNLGIVLLDLGLVDQLCFQLLS